MGVELPVNAKTRLGTIAVFSREHVEPILLLLAVSNLSVATLGYYGYLVPYLAFIIKVALGIITILQILIAFRITLVVSGERVPVSRDRLKKRAIEKYGAEGGAAFEELSDEELLNRITHYNDYEGAPLIPQKEDDEAQMNEHC